jgi:antitoxin CcdA
MAGPPELSDRIAMGMPNAHHSGSYEVCVMDQSPRSAMRRPTNVTLPDYLLREAKALHVNVSQACERGLAAEIAEAKTRLWLKENRAAMDAWNEFVERQGLPLTEYRQF